MIASHTYDPGPQSLICAMMHQALADYFILHRAGFVQWCKVTGRWRNQKNGATCYQNIFPEDCKTLVEFIERDAGRVMSLAGIEVQRDAVKRRILALERSGEWKRYFGQGVGSRKKGQGDNSSVASCDDVGNIDT